MHKHVNGLVRVSCPSSGKMPALLTASTDLVMDLVLAAIDHGSPSVCSFGTAVEQTVELAKFTKEALHLVQLSL